METKDTNTVVEVPTIFGPKKVLKNGEAYKASECGHQCVCRLSNGTVKKCRHFVNAENYIAKTRSELVHEDLVARQLRIDAASHMHDSLVPTQGKMGEMFGKKDAICPVALLGIVVRANTGIDFTIFQCPFVMKRSQKKRE